MLQWGGAFHRWRAFPLGELREHYLRLPPIVFPDIEVASPSAPSQYLRHIGNHRAHQTTVTEPGSSEGPVEREPGLTEVPVSYDL